jgi:hypothetical protein
MAHFEPTEVSDQLREHAFEGDSEQRIFGFQNWHTANVTADRVSSNTLFCAPRALR